MKKIFVAGALLVMSVPLFAQSKHIDSLLNVIDTVQSQKSRVDVLNELGRHYNTSDSAKTALYAGEAMRLAHQIGYLDGLVLAHARIAWANLVLGHYETANDLYLEALFFADSANSDAARSTLWNGLGALAYYQSDYKESINYFEQSLEVRIKQGEQLAIVGSYNNIGIIYEEWGDYSKAFEYYLMALEGYNDLGDHDGKAHVLNNMGVVFKKREEYRKAIEYHLESLAIVQELQFKDRMISSHTNLGTCYLSLDLYDSAHLHYRKSLEISEDLGSQNGLGHAYQNLGVVNYELGNIEVAKEHFLQAYDIRRELGSKKHISQTALWIGRLLRESGLYTIAMEYLNEAYEVAIDVNSMEAIRDASNELHLLHKDLGDHRQALKYFTEFHEVENELNDEDKTRAFIRAEEQFEFKQRQDSIEFANEKATLLLNERINRQQTTQIAFGVGASFLLVLLFILYRFYRVKTRANIELSSLNAQIEYSNQTLKELNEDKNKLLGVVAHDLRSPLNQIKGFLNLHVSIWGDSEEKLLDHASKATDRLSIMVDRILDISALESKKIDLRIECIEVNSLLAQMAINFKTVLGEKDQEVQLSTNDREVHIEADRNYLIQVLENLIGNASKYAAPGTQILLGATLDDGRVTIAVGDQGPGISPEEQKDLFQEFSTISSQTTAGEKATGLGLSIVKKYVEAMNGVIGLESTVGVGSTFQIHFTEAIGQLAYASSDVGDEGLGIVE